MGTYRLAITDGFEPDEFEFFSPFGDEKESVPVENLSQLTFFANLTDEQKNKMMECCNVSNQSLCIDSYLEKVTHAISDVFGESAANIITLELKNSSQFANIDIERTPELCISDAQKILHEAINTSTLSARVMCDALADYYEGDSDKKAKIANFLPMATCPHFRYHPLPAICRKTNKVTYCNAISVSSVLDFFTLMAILTIKEDKPIGRCKNCNKYFIPVSKRDEIYCLDCRSISYDQKIKENDILSSYRRIYKKQSARKQRNSHRPMIDEKFEQWKNMAVTVRAQCQAGIITLDEMETAISSRDWLDGKGGTNGND